MTTTANSHNSSLIWWWYFDQANRKHTPFGCSVAHRWRLRAVNINYGSITTKFTQHRYLLWDFGCFCKAITYFDSKSIASRAIDSLNAGRDHHDNGSEYVNVCVCCARRSCKLFWNIERRATKLAEWRQSHLRLTHFHSLNYKNTELTLC